MTKLIASNTDEKLEEAAKDAFAAYAKNEPIANVIAKLKEPLKGVGPATASLLLAIHDPQNVIFFSDELFRWLTAGGKKVKIAYTTEEFETLFAAAKTFMARIKCTPIELEKAAFVLIKEKEPIPEPKPKAVPSGKPRGRPPLPESEKKPKKPTVPGRGRGRPAKSDEEKAATAKAKAAAKPAPKPKPAKAEKAEKAAKVSKQETVASKKRGRPTAAEEEETSATPATKKRGPSVTKTSATKTPATKSPATKAPASNTPASKKRGRPSLASAAEEQTPASKKRKSTATPASSAKRSGKSKA